eukprot:6187082-Pleurochrysis_carterae.AAC.2
MNFSELIRQMLSHDKGTGYDSTATLRYALLSSAQCCRASKTQIRTLCVQRSIADKSFATNTDNPSPTTDSHNFRHFANVTYIVSFVTGRVATGWPQFYDIVHPYIDILHER